MTPQNIASRRAGSVRFWDKAARLATLRARSGARTTVVRPWGEVFTTALQRKGLIVGAIALVVASSAAIVGIRALTNDEGSNDSRSACRAWNARASAAARIRAVQLQTRGAQVAVFLNLDVSS